MHTMRILLAVLTLQVVSCLDLTDTKWIYFKAKYNRTYSSPEEEVKRLGIFRDNLRHIEEHNSQPSSFWLGVGPLADRSPDEYRRLLSPAAAHVRHRSAPSAPLHPQTGAMPTGTTKDWRDEGAVTPVRHRLSGCDGGSWAFAAASAVESAWKIAGNPLVGLSEQQLLDCSSEYGTSGCQDGLPEQAFAYLAASKGLARSADYSYYSGDWQECRDAPPPHARVTSWRYTTRGSEVELEHVLATVGPVAARLDADHTAFQLYSGGVYDQRECSTYQLTLSVQIVGYGTEELYGRQIPYWLVRNAWGPSWGELGYIKVRKDAANMCGIATDVTYPLVA